MNDATPPDVVVEIVEPEHDRKGDGYVAFWLGTINGEETPGNGPEIVVSRLPGFADLAEDYIGAVCVYEPEAPEAHRVAAAVFEYLAAQGDSPTWEGFVAWALDTFAPYEEAVLEAWGYVFL